MHDVVMLLMSLQIVSKLYAIVLLVFDMEACHNGLWAECCLYSIIRVKHVDPNNSDHENFYDHSCRDIIEC